MAANEWRSLCAMVFHAIGEPYVAHPAIKWRHNGLGCLQGYVLEGEHNEVRIHIWHPSLRRAGIEDNGLYHDHRFNMVSQVLVGIIKQRDLPRYRMRDVLHARAKHEASGGVTYHEEPGWMPGEYIVGHADVLVHQSNSYFFPNREFHGTYPMFDERNVVVTLVTKAGQSPEKARILAREDLPFVHAFSDPLPESAWAEPLEAARAALRSAWTKSFIGD
jgi:hypothetical protein